MYVGMGVSAGSTSDKRDLLSSNVDYLYRQVMIRYDPFRISRSNPKPFTNEVHLVQLDMDPLGTQRLHCKRPHRYSLLLGS